MRDDIHRKLPLPRAWKRLVRSCNRPAESNTWAERANHAIAYEIRQLSADALAAAARACEQPEFFGRTVPSIASVATTPGDHALAQEVGVARDRTARAALENAVCRAIEQRAQAQLREARIHLTLQSPRDAGSLVARLRTAIAGVDVPALVARTLEGERLPITRRRVPVDYEEDIRPRR